MDPQPKILYENKDFLAVEKPAGLVVHAAKISQRNIAKKSFREAVRLPEPTLVNWLLEHRPEIKNVGDDPVTRPGIVHRLDKETSGVMLIPKTQAYFEYLKSLFQKHEIRKTYYAVVYGVPKNKEGIIDAPIGIRNGTLKRSIRSKKMRKEAVTEYKVVKTWSDNGKDGGNNDGNFFSLVEVHPKTGRTHQIRVHLASIGHPILGDVLYGRRSKKNDRGTLHYRLMLHAFAIEFSEEDNGKRIHIESQLPPEFH